MNKELIERLLYKSGPAHLARFMAGGRTLVLAYHNIVPESVTISGESVLHLPIETFRAQLDLLTRTHEIVALEDALNSNSCGTSSPRVVLTFDDAYCGAVTIGARELARRGLPGTFFVAPSFVNGRTFWWDVIESTANKLSSWEEFRQLALSEWKGDDALIRKSAEDFGLATHEVSRYERCASVNALQEAAALPGITIASHSWTHRDLTHLAEGELRRELTRPMKWVRDYFPDAAIPWLSYPYGRSSRRVERMARTVNYKGALRLTDNSWLPNEDDERWRLPRFSIPHGISRWGFGLRVSGL